MVNNFLLELRRVDTLSDRIDALATILNNPNVLTTIDPWATTHHIPAYAEYESKDVFIKSVLVHYFTETKCMWNCSDKVIIDLEVHTFACPLLSKGACLSKGNNKRDAAINKYRELYGEEALFEVLL